MARSINFLGFRAPIVLSIAILVALSTFALPSVNAVVVIGSSGPTWSGTCSVTTCTSASPCQLSATTTIATTSSCDITFASGLAAPAFALTYSGSTTLTFRTLGAITLPSAVTVNVGTSSTIRFIDFTASFSAEVALTSGTVNFQNVQLSTSSNQVFKLNSATTIGITGSTFTSSQALIQVPTNSAAVTMTNVVGTGNGVIAAPVGTGGDFTATDCVFSSNVAYGTSRFNNIVWNNVTATMAAAGGKLFGFSPKVIDFTAVTLSCAVPARLTDAAGVTGTSASVKSSTWTNVGLTMARIGTGIFSDFTIILDDQTASALDLNAGVTTSLSFTNVYFQSKASTGTTLLPLVRIQATQPITIANSNLTIVQASGTTTAGLFIGVGTYTVSNAQVFPSLLLGGGVINWFSPAVAFTGNIYDSGSTGSLYLFSGQPGAVTGVVGINATSITIGNAIVYCPSSVPYMNYLVNKPSQGIQCLVASDCFRLRDIVSPYVNWDYATLGLPTIGTAYPFIQGTPNFYQVTASSEWSIQGDQAGTTATYSFFSVTCNSSCVAANSGPCVSRSVCSCKSGWILPTCQCPTGGCVPVAPPTNPPTSTPVGPVPVPVNPPTTPPTTPPVGPVPVTVPVTPPTTPPTTPPVGPVPITPPTNPPTNPPTGPVPTNPPTTVPTTPPTNPPTATPTNPPTNPPTATPVSTPVATPVTPPVAPVPSETPIAPVPSNPPTTTPVSPQAPSPVNVPTSTPVNNPVSPPTSTPVAPQAPSSQPPTSVPSSTPTSTPSPATSPSVPSSTPSAPSSTPRPPPSRAPRGAASSLAFSPLVFFALAVFYLL